MRRMICVACLHLLLVASALAAGPPSIDAPSVVYGPVGEYAWFKVSHDGKNLKVFPLSPGVQVFPSEKLKDSNEVGVRASAPGEYRVLLYTGNAEGASDPKVVTVVFGGSPVPPDPGPKPPDPPTPTPGVDQELAKKFKTALDGDVRLFGAVEKTHCAKLGQIYLACAKRLRAETAVLTFGQFYTITFNASTEAGIPRRDKSLPGVRGVIDSLGTFASESKLEGEVKDKTVALWERIGGALVEAAK